MNDESRSRAERPPRALPGRAWLIAAGIVVISIGVISLVLLGVAISEHRRGAALTACVGVLVGILGAATVVWAIERQRLALTEVSVATERLREATGAARGKRSESARREAHDNICGCLDHAHRAQRRVRRVDAPAEHAALDAAILEADARVRNLNAEARTGSSATADDRDREHGKRSEDSEGSGGVIALLAAVGVAVLLVLISLLGVVALGTSTVLISHRRHEAVDCLSKTTRLTNAIRANPGVAELLTTKSRRGHPQLRLSRAFNAECGNIQIIVRILLAKLPAPTCPCVPPPCQTTCSRPPTPPTTSTPPTSTPSSPFAPTTTAPGSPPTTNRGFAG